MGEGEKALQCIGCFLFCFFLQIADSRWLTSLAETVNVIEKKLGPGGVSIYNMYIYIYTYTYIYRERER